MLLNSNQKKLVLLHHHKTKMTAEEHDIGKNLSSENLKLILAGGPQESAVACSLHSALLLQ